MELQPRVTASPDALAVDEGATAFYTLVLEPEAPRAGEIVTVTPTSADDTVADTSGAVTFSDADWNVPKTVTVTGVVDSDSLADPAVTITHPVTSSLPDGRYASAGGLGTVVADDVLATVTDVDAEAFIGGADTSAVEGDGECAD